MIRVLALAAVATLGFVGALALAGGTAATASCEPSVSEALISNRIVGGSQSYRRDSPNEYTRVRAYLDGGARPSTSGMSHMGLHLVYLEETCRAPDVTTTVTTTTTVTETDPPPPPPPPPAGTVLWKADYNTGNFSQWPTAIGIEGPASASIVTSPVAEGSHAARFQVGPFTSGNARVEYEQADPAKNGTASGATSTYDLDFYVPASTVFMPHPSHNNLVQYKIQFTGGGCTGSGLIVDATNFGDGPHYILRIRGGQVTDPGGGCSMTTDLRLDLGPVTRDRWTHFRWTIKWSHDPAVGFVEAGRDGVNVVPKRFNATMLNVSGLIHKLRQGIYQGPHSGTTTVFMDGLTVTRP